MIFDIEKDAALDNLINEFYDTYGKEYDEECVNDFFTWFAESYQMDEDMVELMNNAEKIIRANMKGCEKNV